MNMKNLASAAVMAAGLAFVGGCSGMGGGAMGGMGAALGPIGAITQVGSMMAQPKPQQQPQPDAQQAGYQQRPPSTSMSLTGTLKSTRNAGGVVEGWLLSPGEGGVAYDLDVSDVQDEANQLDGKKVAVTGTMRTDAGATAGRDEGEMPTVKATKIIAL